MREEGSLDVTMAPADPTVASTPASKSPPKLAWRTLRSYVANVYTLGGGVF